MHCKTSWRRRYWTRVTILWPASHVTLIGVKHCGEEDFNEKDGD